MGNLLNALLLFAATAPFAMPPSAVATDGKPEGGGWRQSGEMPLSYRQTRAQFASRLAAAGWRHKHDVPIAKERTVEAWEREGETLTLMSWGIAPDKTGFSWGVTRKDRSRDAEGVKTSPNAEPRISRMTRVREGRDNP